MKGTYRRCAWPSCVRWAPGVAPPRRTPPPERAGPPRRVGALILPLPSQCSGSC